MEYSKQMGGKPSRPLPHNHGQTLEQQAMPKADDFQTAAEIFKLLDDGNRSRIFWLLCHCEECVVNIASMVEMSSPAVSHHLRQLKAGGLIVSRRSGKEVYYRAADTKEARLMHWIIEQVLRISCPNHEPVQ